MKKLIVSLVILVAGLANSVVFAEESLEKSQPSQKLKGTWVWNQMTSTATLIIEDITALNEIRGAYTYKQWVFPFEKEGRLYAEGKVELKGSGLTIFITLHPGGSNYELTYSKFFSYEALQGTFISAEQGGRRFDATFYKKR